MFTLNRLIAFPELSRGVTRLTRLELLDVDDVIGHDDYLSSLDTAEKLVPLTSGIHTGHHVIRPLLYLLGARHYVEIGSWKGSSVCLAESYSGLRSVTAIDPATVSDDQASVLLANMKTCNVHNQVVNLLSRKVLMKVTQLRSFATSLNPYNLVRNPLLTFCLLMVATKKSMSWRISNAFNLSCAQEVSYCSMTMVILYTVQVSDEQLTLLSATTSTLGTRYICRTLRGGSVAWYEQ